MKSMLMELSLVAFLCGFIGFISTGFWFHPLSLPLSYEDDALFTTLLIQNTVEGNWWQLPRLAAPFGSNLYDFPSLDAANLFLVFLLSFFTHNAFLIQNLFFLITFSFAGASSYFVVRKLGYVKLLAICAAIIFSTIPYHFVRGDKHLFLANYWYVPLVSLFLISLLEKQTWNKKSFWAVVCLAVLAGSSGIYPAYFSLLLVSTVTFIKVFISKNFRCSFPALLFIFTVIAAALAQLLPVFIYRSNFGQNPIVAQRHGFEVVNNGLQFLFMLIPLESFGLEALKRFNTSVIQNMEQQQYLGVTSLIGLLLAGYSTLKVFFDQKLSSRTKVFTLCIIVILAIALSSGLSVIIGYVITAQIRSYSRLIPFLSFFCILLLCEVLRKMPSRYNLFLILLTIIAIFDQTGWYLPATNTIESAFSSDKTFFSSIEKSLSMSKPNPNVFQLPYKPFPESPPILHSKDYDLLKPHLHTNTVHWSYGASKGRVTDLWNQSTASQPPSVMMKSLEVYGFSGLLIDTAAYKPLELQKYLLELPEITLVSQDKRWIYIALTKPR